MLRRVQTEGEELLVQSETGGAEPARGLRLIGGGELNGLREQVALDVFQHQCVGVFQFT